MGFNNRLAMSLKNRSLIIEKACNEVIEFLVEKRQTKFINNYVIGIDEAMPILKVVCDKYMLNMSFLIKVIEIKPQITE